ncbi:MAG: hypothetical protein WAN50_04385, partial [Minisyncoccia bacterium]
AQPLCPGIVDERLDWKNYNVTDLARLHGFRTEYQVLKDVRTREIRRRGADSYPNPMSSPSDQYIQSVLSAIPIALREPLTPQDIRTRMEGVLPPKDEEGNDQQGKWLEVLAFIALRDALEGLQAPYWLTFSARFARGGRDPADKEFDLDVTAVIGYQLLAVSCSTSSGEKQIKEKAFEALHRARQVGGGAARAIVLSLGTKDAVERVKEDVRDVFGADGSSVDVWDYRRLEHLTFEFRDYLEQEMRLSFGL